MLLPISKIKHQPGLSREYQVSQIIPPSAAAEYSGFALVGPVSFSGRVTNESDGLFRLDGEYQGEIAYSCSRCLADCQKSVSGHIQALFREDISSLEEDEVDIRQLTGEDIYVDDLILSDISFGLPMQLLCRADCRGLCPVCGTDLNKKACTCGDSKIDPRWEKLKDFKFTSD